MEAFSDFDRWDPDLTPPRLWHCRACNGQGYYPYGEPCFDCRETGHRWRFVYTLSYWRFRIRFRLDSLRWRFALARIRALGRIGIRWCSECHRPERIGRRRMFDHTRCIPF